MNGRAALTFSFLAAWAVGAGLTLTPPAAGAGKKGADADLFGLTKVHKVHLRLTAEQWGKLQPAAPRFGFMPGGPPGGQPKAGDRHRNTFGTEFPWARGELTFNGKTL